ncbi:MAG: hypothetical protein E3K32_09665 [wastewater metagenome]|nr:hypothetical protein [Candidatus Loosdrechtia aerotolerans]
MSTDMITPTNIDNISFTEDVCADGICCFMSIPRNQSHLGKVKFFLKRGNASYGIKLLYTAPEVKDIVYNPCRCLNFSLREIPSSHGTKLQMVLRCSIINKRCRPYTCKAFPDKADSFMYDLLAPCIYNEYRASGRYVKLKHKHIFHLFYAFKDDRKLLGKIFPGYTAEEVRKKLSQCSGVGKVCAVWDEKKPSEYFLLEIPKVDSIVYVSDVHPRIEGVKQAYNCWQGHIESWLERHYGSKWQDSLDYAIEQEGSKRKK